ncbi:MAG: 16S rRNA (guanine(527)-N(7))-methyltransferase RsmG [Candidatus Paceibacterota bacterium]|jgi:16S rRNA (guanine527-N7)-methyltransferase
MTTLQDYAKQIGIELSAEVFLSFNHYMKILLEWNEKINLTSITEEHDVILKHFADSLSLLPYIPTSAKTLIDIGSGAGFPGLAVAIARPNLQVTLVESIGKKAVFLEQCAKDLRLKNVFVVEARAEELGQDKKFREKFDIATGRAVAFLPVLAEYTIPLLKIGGLFLAQKNDDKIELEQAERSSAILGGKIQSVHHVPLPFETPRVIIVIEKINITPKEFPRPIGTPKQEPL